MKGARVQVQRISEGQVRLVDVPQTESATNLRITTPDGTVYEVLVDGNTLIVREATCRSVAVSFSGRNAIRVLPGACDTGDA